MFRNFEEDIKYSETSVDDLECAAAEAIRTLIREHARASANMPRSSYRAYEVSKAAERTAKGISNILVEVYKLRAQKMGS